MLVGHIFLLAYNAGLSLAVETLPPGAPQALRRTGKLLTFFPYMLKHP
jgi:hypothetical protein